MSLPTVAYYSMEMAIDKSLKTYSGGLGFLSGSHMQSAGQLNLPMIGVTILWAQGYGKQQINANGEVELVYEKNTYPFLKETGITVTVEIFGQPVQVKALKLESETFGTVPVYFLTTDVPENTPEQRALTNVLYDSEQHTRISQEIILGRAGFLVLEAAGEEIDLVHINEGHALPALFQMLQKYQGNLDEVRRHSVFTTHTPVTAGNECHPVHLLAEAGFFAGASVDLAIALGGHDFSLTVAALRMCHLANGVSQLHGHVANNMWKWVDGRCPIIAITNSVNVSYWQDARIKGLQPNGLKNPHGILDVKKEMKKELFDYVKAETGKVFDPNILTLVWARRFTQYKRANLVLSDPARLAKLVDSNKIQILFAGKFHPSDTVGRETFNQIVKYTQNIPHMAILPNYELDLSKRLKKGADIWLNTPLRPLEASGTSGMSANMNAAIHLTTNDGWAVEGTFHGINGFIINENNTNTNLSVEEVNQHDYESLMALLENTLIPMYYDKPDEWSRIVWNAIRTAVGYFDSERMVIEYFNRLYRPVAL